MLRREIKNTFYLQNYWVFGPCLWPSFLNIRGYDVSENVSVSVLRRGGDTRSAGFLRKS